MPLERKYTQKTRRRSKKPHVQGVGGRGAAHVLPDPPVTLAATRETPRITSCCASSLPARLIFSRRLPFIYTLPPFLLIFPPAFLLDTLPACLLSTCYFSSLPACLLLPSYLPTYSSFLPARLLFSCLPTLLHSLPLYIIFTLMPPISTSYLPTSLPVYLSLCLPASLIACSPICLPPYSPTPCLAAPPSHLPAHRSLRLDDSHAARCCVMSLVMVQIPC